MIHAMEKSSPLAVSIAKLRPQAKLEKTTPIPALKSSTAFAGQLPAQTDRTAGPYNRLKAAILRQVLAQDSGFTFPAEKTAQAQTPTPGISSQAESIFTALAATDESQPRPAETAFRPPLSSSPAPTVGERGEKALRELAALAEGIRFPKLDASWKVLPTAEFAKHAYRETHALLA